MSRFRHYLITNEIGDVSIDPNLDKFKIADIVNSIMDLEKDLSYIIASYSNEKGKNYILNFKRSCVYVADLLLKSVGVGKE